MNWPIDGAASVTLVIYQKGGGYKAAVYVWRFVAAVVCFSPSLL